jgi:hypothetical protein
MTRAGKPTNSREARRKRTITAACVWGDLEERAMARLRQKRSSNDDLVEAAEGQLHNILGLYKLFKEKRPVMVFDLQSEKIYAYPYDEYKATLSESSRAMLTIQYDEAMVENKIVVFVRDNETRRLTSMSFKNE